MAENIQVPRQRTDPQTLLSGGSRLIPPRTIPMPLSPKDIRSGHKSLRTFSPVNESGSFEFDRVLKSGELLKRTRRTKNWKPVFLVLRPNLLSIYKDRNEAQLRHQLTLSDITAVALQKDRKRKEHAGAFGLFSPSRNFHFEASTENEARTWVDLIRSEARLDAQEEEIMFGSPGNVRDPYSGFGRIGKSVQMQNDAAFRTRGLSSSSSEPDARGADDIAPFTLTKRRTARQASSTMDYSGNDQASYSDFSDAHGAEHGKDSPPQSSYSNHTAPIAPTSNNIYTSAAPAEVRNASQLSGLGKLTDADRVVWQGYLFFLKSNRGGVRQWKKCWVVLRPKTLALYKNDDEYSASLIVPITSILDAVEIDPISRSKQYCMQIIAEDRSYRFAAVDEDDLSKWLGGMKSLLAKRKDPAAQRATLPE